MDVIFVQESGESFSIEVGFFDSFLEVKEKVQKYKGIPVSKQSLFFNGQPLQDDGVIIESDLTQDSRIQLQITPATPPHPPLPPLPTLQVTPATPPPPPLPPLPTLRVTPATPPPLPLPPLPTLQVTPATPPPPPPPPIKVKLKVELLRVIQRTIIQVTMDLDDTVLQLKEKIYEQRKTVPLDDMTLLLSTPTSIDEMLDHQSLRELRVSNRSKVYLENKKQPPEQVAPLPQAPPPSGGLRLKVSHVRGTEKITVEVKASAKVRGLRKVLEKSHERVLPEDRRYFFIHKESVMHENESYQWHQVKDGDTIEIFNGHIIDHKQ